MAKIAKAKKREVTVHSRAARRAASPSIDIDKSLKSKAPDSTSPARAAAKPKPHVLAAKSAGITKKSKSKPLKRQQRVRQLRAIDKAADTMDKMELKVQRSTGKDKKVRERKKGWEEVNGGKRKKGKNPFETLDGDEDEADATKREWVSDEDMPEAEPVDESAEAGLQLEVSGEVKEVIVAASVPLPLATVEDDELL